MLIGITGKAGAGKDTVADFFAMRLDATIYHFADPLKDMAYQLDPIVFWDEREEPIRLQEVVDDLGWDRAKVLYPDVRRTLQRLGTECVRGTFGDLAWVDLMLDQYYSSPYHHFIVPDVRFRTEADSIQHTGHGILIRVFRGMAHELGDNAGHASETEQDTLDVDYTIVNDGDKQDLHRKVVRLIDEIGLR